MDAGCSMDLKGASVASFKGRLDAVSMVLKHNSDIHLKKISKQQS